MGTRKIIETSQIILENRLLFKEFVDILANISLLSY
jgi:hypothetical protein